LFNKKQRTKQHNSPLNALNINSFLATSCRIYFPFLFRGNDFPMEQLKKAGVDLSKPEAILAVINQLDKLVDQLAIEIEKLEK